MVSPLDQISFLSHTLLLSRRCFLLMTTIPITAAVDVKSVSTSSRSSAAIFNGCEKGGRK